MSTLSFGSHLSQPEGVDYAPSYPRTHTILLAHPAKVASYTPVEIWAFDKRNKAKSLTSSSHVFTNFESTYVPMKTYSKTKKSLIKIKIKNKKGQPIKKYFVKTIHWLIDSKIGKTFDELVNVWSWSFSPDPKTNSKLNTLRSLLNEPTRLIPYHRY